MKTRFYQPLFLLALLFVAGGVSQRAHAQYQSFFGDSITEYSIGAGLTRYCDDYDPFFFNVQSYDLYLSATNTITSNNQLYYYYPYWGEFYLREDTTTGQLFRYVPTCDTELLICDLSLSVGDTFIMPHQSIEIPIVVDSVWYLNSQKYIRFRNCGYWPRLISDASPDTMRYSIMFVEGIGPNYSPVGWLPEDAYCTGGHDFSPLLLCVHKDGDLIYMADERAGCFQYLQGLRNDIPTTLKLYPNPAKKKINLEFGEVSLGGQLYISDMWGRIIYQELVSSRKLLINLNNLSPGIYVVIYIVEQKKYTSKFIKR